MSFRLRLPNQIHGLLCIARRINGLTFTHSFNHLFHFLEGLTIFEYVVNPLQELPRSDYLGNLPSLLSLYLEIETS